MSNILSSQIKGCTLLNSCLAALFLGWVWFFHWLLTGSDFYSFQWFHWPPAHSLLGCSFTWLPISQSPYIKNALRLFFLQCSENNYKSFESRIKNKQFDHIKANFWKPLHTEIQSQTEDKLRTLQEQLGKNIFSKQTNEKVHYMQQFKTPSPSTYCFLSPLNSYYPVVEFFHYR